MPGPPAPSPRLRQDLDRALSGLGRHLGLPLRLDRRDAVGLRIGGVAEDITVEWVPSGQCVAVHTAAPRVLAQLPAEGIALQLMQWHLVGALSSGCTYWMTPDAQVRIGALLLGPGLEEESLLDAIGRVSYLARQLQTRLDPTNAPRRRSA